MTSKSGAARAIVTVHGTWAGDRNEIKPRWWEKNSAFCESLIGENPHNTEPADIHEFIWSGENSFLYREAATNALIEFLAPLSKEYNQIDIIAHSHGGNIVSNALYANKKKSEAALANVRNVVSVGTRFFGRRTPLLRRFAKLFICIGQIYAFLLALAVLYFGFVLTSAGDFFIVLGVLAFVIGFAILFVLYWLNRKGSRFRVLISNRSTNPSINWHVISHENDEAINALMIAENTHYRLIKKDTIRRTLTALFSNIFMVSLGCYMIFVLYTLYHEITESSWAEDLGIQLPTKLLLIPLGIYIVGFAIFWVIGRLFGGPLANFANNRISGGIRAVVFGQDGPTILRNIQDMPHKYDADRLPIDASFATKMSAEVEVLRAEYFDTHRDQLSKLVVGQSLADLLNGLPIEGLDEAMLHTTYFDHGEVVKMIARAIYQPGEIQAP